jgi:hypothetical protein
LHGGSGGWGQVTGTAVVAHGGGVGGHVCGFGVVTYLHLHFLLSGLLCLHVPVAAMSNPAAAIMMKMKTIPLVPMKAMAGDVCWLQDGGSEKSDV